MVGPLRGGGGITNDEPLRKKKNFVHDLEKKNWPETHETQDK